MKFYLKSLAVAAALIPAASHAQSQPPSVPTACLASVVTTGGTAVTAIKQGSIPNGAIISNPSTAPGGEPIFVDASGATATGTAGGTNFMVAAGGSPWVSGPINAPVSVYAATSGHAFNCQVQ